MIGMLTINMEDVYNVLDLCKPYLIAMAVFLVTAILCCICVRKLAKPKRALIRKESWLVVLASFVVILNMIYYGPLSNMLSLVSTKYEISQETAENATQLCEDVSAEGIVLLKNDDGGLPLSAKTKLNVFGWASTNPCYGGTGSGSLSDTYEKVSLLDGLKNAGFDTNDELSSFYTSYCDKRPDMNTLIQDWTLPEPPLADYSDELLADAKTYSDTALVVLTRIGGEGADIPVNLNSDNITFENNSEDYLDFPDGSHYLELSQTEKDMLDYVCDNFSNVLVVYNGANTMELDFVNQYPSIKSCIWCPGAGQSGFNALGQILSGKINPSGKTSDIFVKDLMNTPTANNYGTGDFAYDNMDDYGNKSGDTVTPVHFTNYVEGIYVGYRFWETAANEGLVDYDANVLYPFGYGLSYTSFSQTLDQLEAKDGTITATVTVTNTGDVAGKDVVQLYVNPPYTNGGIEKASANLVAFDKTDLLEPGKSQTLTLTLSEEDLASYDSVQAKAYVLEAGDYIFSINSDSHHILASQTYAVPETITYDEQNPRSTDLTVATNQFDDAAGNVTYLSRADHFANYDAATTAPSTTMEDAEKALFVNKEMYLSQDHTNADDQMPTTGKDNGIDLAEMRGVDYDDAKWDDFLDQLTAKEMNNLIGLCGFQTPAVDSVGKIMTTDCDGPSAINNNFTGIGSIGLPSAIVLACTWNEDLAHAFGDCIGAMADEMNVTGWYAPGLNTHRNAFCGRNFEYYSEDPLLSGSMASQEILGAADHGVYAYVKHFALNEQENHRQEMLCTWANEQSIREIYLKPFEQAVKEGHTMGIMTAFNYIGGKWAGASSELLVNVLRNEWGFSGMVITDYFTQTGYMNADQMLANGGDAILISYECDNNLAKDYKSATAVTNLRRATKNIMYTVVNSRAYATDNTTSELTKYDKLVIGADIFFAALILLLELLAIRKYKKSTK